MSDDTAVGAHNWLATLRLYLVLALALHLSWETLQLPLYTIGTSGTLWQKAFAVAHCRAGDVMIAALVLLAAVLLVGTNTWPHQGARHVFALVIVVPTHSRPASFCGVIHEREKRAVNLAEYDSRKQAIQPNRYASRRRDGKGIGKACDADREKGIQRRTYGTKRTGTVMASAIAGARTKSWQTPVAIGHSPFRIKGWLPTMTLLRGSDL